MPIPAGTRLGPYVVEAQLGAGGMGEVYRARDTRLDRTVAIKVLPPSLAADPQFRERFEREARAISSLEHAHICPLYDVGREREIDYLVMQYLEGETLAARLQKGSIPKPQALTIAVEIAGALASAHRRGIVHRDLKPGNIMLTKSGAKLLDFGLAKEHRGPAPAADLAMPTVTSPLTAQGTVLGTVQYMAPEQVNGADADARTDIFAFGAILYEMLAGRPAFEGATTAQLMSAILRDQPRAEPLEPAIDRLVRRCLAKDPDDRWQSAADLGSELRWVAEDRPRAGTTVPAARRRRLPIVVASIAALALIVAVVAGARLLERAPALPLIRFAVLPPVGGSFTPAAVAGTIQPALSPDGRTLAFVASSGSGPSALWIRRLDEIETHALAETEGASFPFWSPDSQSIGFFARAKLRRVDAAGGPVEVLADAPSGRGGAWSETGVIVFSPSSGAGLLKVSAHGGETTAATNFATAGSPIRAQYWPEFLPDGRTFLFFSLGATSDTRGVYAGTLGSLETRRLLAADTRAVFANGHVFYVRQSILLAQRFDPRSLATSGEPVAVADRIAFFPNFGHAAFTASANGLIAYASSVVATGQPTWFDRTGTVMGTLGSPAVYLDGPRVAADERRIAVSIVDTQTSTSDIWVMDAARQTSTRLTFAPASEMMAVWSPDGSHVGFSSDRTGAPDLYEKLASGSGSEELVLGPGPMRWPSDWSADGRVIVFHEAGPQGYDISIMDTASKTVTPFLRTPFNEAQGRLSPDGRWLAYTSDESGRPEVYVQPFPATGAKSSVSTSGGSQPAWRGDGRELFYIAADRTLMAVDVQSGGSGLDVGVPHGLFRTNTPAYAAPYYHYYSVSGDGQRFLVNTLGREGANPPITVVINWSGQNTGR
jgi:eukaryotic-like serine/threonine-protein kinase